MKLGMVVSDMTISGGYQKLVLRLSEELERLGHEVAIYTRVVDWKRCYPELIRDAHIVALREGEDTPKTLDEKIVEYQELAHRIDPDTGALILHDYTSFYLLNFLELDPKPKTIWMVNNQPPIELGNWRLHLKLALKGNRAQIKRLAEDLKDDIRLNRAFKHIDYCATYDSLNQELASRVTGRPSVTVLAGADIEDFAALSRDKMFLTQKKYRILSVGVIFPYRRYEDLIKAVALLRKEGIETSATIVGAKRFSPEHHEELLALIRRLKLEKFVEIQDEISSAALKKLYSSSDAFVFINNGNTWGISVFEAVAAEIPVVITSNIGAADLIEDGRTGWVVPPKSPESVASALKEIFGDRKKAEQVAKLAKKEVVPKVTWPAYAERMVELITKESG